MVNFIQDWHSLTKEEKISLGHKNKIVSLAQLLNNSTNKKYEYINDFLDLLEPEDKDVVDFNKLIKDIKVQKEVFGKISIATMQEFEAKSQNIFERLGSVFLASPKNEKRYVDTLNQHFFIYTHILINSGILYTEPQVSGRVNSSFLRKNHSDRIKEIHKPGKVILDIDFKACQPSILNSFLNVFPEKDFYTGFANALGKTRDEAKDLALKKYVWGPIKHESLNKIYEWREQFYNRAQENDCIYTMRNGKNLFLNDMDEMECLNRYCQAAESQLIHDIAYNCITKTDIANGNGYLAAIVYDELLFVLDNEKSIEQIKQEIIKTTEDKLEMEIKIIK